MSIIVKIVILVKTKPEVTQGKGDDNDHTNQETRI
jgi:hypothetical protein